MPNGYFKLHKSDKDTNEPYWFVLHAGNHEPIARSEMYPTKAAMMVGVKSVQTNGSTTDIKDETEK